MLEGEAGGSQGCVFSSVGAQNRGWGSPDEEGTEGRGRAVSMERHHRMSHPCGTLVPPQSSPHPAPEHALFPLTLPLSRRYFPPAFERPGGPSLMGPLWGKVVEKGTAVLTLLVLLRGVVFMAAGTCMGPSSGM